MPLVTPFIYNAVIPITVYKNIIRFSYALQIVKLLN